MSENKNELFENPDKFRAHLEQLEKIPEPEQQPKEQNDVNISQPPEESPPVQTATEENAETTGEEPASDSNEDSVEDYKEKKFIPKSRFNQEIEKRKVLEEQLSKEKEERIRYETQLQMLAAMQENNANQTLQVDPFDAVDPLDSDSHKLYMHKIHELEKKLENIGQETAAKTQQLQYYNMVSAQEAAFSKKHPDFNDALAHVKNVEMQLASHFYPAGQTEQYVAQKLQNTLVTAVNAGKNAAELMYNMAKTYGYSATPKAVGPQSNLDAINNNMKKSASIQSLGNAANAGNNVATDINSMRIDPSNPYSKIDGEKFQRAIQKLNSMR